MEALKKTPMENSAASLKLLLPRSSVNGADALLRILEGLTGADVIHHEFRETNIQLCVRLSTDQDESRFEVLKDGLSFDLTYLGRPMLDDLAGFDVELRSTAGLTCENCIMLAIAPGEHLSGAERNLAVLRAQFAIAGDLCVEMPSALVAWPPALVTVGAATFVQCIQDWRDPSSAPARLMFPLSEVLDGALQSDGLSYLTGQELRLEGPLAQEEDAVQLGGWLSLLLAREGTLDTGARVAAPDGRYLALEPTTNGRFVRVRLV